MIKKIIITESQFNRLFLNEQLGGGISGIGNISKELPISDRKTPDYKKLIDSIDIHTVIDIASIVSLGVPLVGPFLSVGFELLNGVLYFNEGDNMSAGLSIALSLVPGGLLLRRSLSSRKILSKVDNLLIKHPKILKSKNPNDIINLIKKELGNEGEKNMDLIIKYLNTIKRIPVDKLQDFKNLTKNYPKLFREFTKNEKILTQFLKSNNNNFYDAFKSYISKFTKKEIKSSLSIYTSFLVGIKSVEEGISRYKKHLEDIGVKKENIKEAEVLLNNLIDKKIEIKEKKIKKIDNIKKIEVLKDTMNVISLSVDSIIIKKNISELETYNNYMDELISETDKISIK